jgi:hypothetical protein
VQYFSTLTFHVGRNARNEEETVGEEQIVAIWKKPEEDAKQSERSERVGAEPAPGEQGQSGA